MSILATVLSHIVSMKPNTSFALFPLLYDPTKDELSIHPACTHEKHWKEYFSQNLFFASEKEHALLLKIENKTPSVKHKSIIEKINKNSKNFLYAPITKLIPVHKDDPINTSVFNSIFHFIKVKECIYVNKPGYVFKVEIGDSKKECVMKICESDVTCYLSKKDPKDSLIIKFDSCSVRMHSGWNEALGWYMCQRSEYYGHFNVCDPYTGKHYVILFMPLFHATFNTLINKVLDHHDRFGRLKVEEYKKNKKIKEEYQESHWPEVFFAHMVDICIRLLLPLKNEFRFCHNDFKINNITYQKVSHKDEIIDLSMDIQQLQYLFPTDYGKYVFDIRNERIAIVRIIYKNYGRHFYLIDFGWSSICINNKWMRSDMPEEAFTDKTMYYDNIFTDYAQFFCNLLMTFELHGMNQENQKLSKEWGEIYNITQTNARNDYSALLNYHKWGDEMYIDTSNQCTGINFLEFLRCLIQKYATKNKVNKEVPMIYVGSLFVPFIKNKICKSK